MLGCLDLVFMFFSFQTGSEGFREKLLGLKPGKILKERSCTYAGNPKLIETLNALLADELAAINQYIVHAEM